MEQGRRFTPQSIKDRDCGPRRSVAALLDLVDTTEPAFSSIAEALQDMADADVQLSLEVVAIAVKVGRQRHAAEAAKRHNQPERRAIVYYIRRGELIKIGTTVDPASRFKVLMPDEILAFEPGGPDREALRHRQFSAHRVARRGEYFRVSDELTAHIRALRDDHGEPDVSWPTVATLGTGYRRTKVKVELPEPQTREVATAAAGARLLGMSKSTIHGWAHRRLITPAGKDRDGRPVYFVEHMRFLIDRNRAWMNHRANRVKSSTP